MTPPIYLALLHFPIIDKNGLLVTTAVTNLDIHDISRSARTYCLKRYFVVTPVLDQHELIGRILDHWQRPKVVERNPDRVEALRLVKLAQDFEAVLQEIETEAGERPEVVMPDARSLEGSISYRDYREELAKPGRTKPVLIVLGTGWGIDRSFFSNVDQILDPVLGPGGREGYNHLSVRAAAAAILDRLFGQ